MNLKPKSWIHLAALAVLMFATMPNSGPVCADTNCDTYQNSRIVIDPREGMVYCGSGGRTCTECISISGGGGGSGGGGIGTCWSSGWSIVCSDGNGGYYLP
jgi:hypothetical protein